MKKTRLISILTAFVLFVTTFTVIAYAKSDKFGDVNGDGKVTVVDSKWVLQSVANARTLTDAQKVAADVDGNGKVTVADAKIILKIVSGVLDENGEEKPTTTETTTQSSNEIPPPPPLPTEPAGEKTGPEPASETGAKCPYPIGVWTTREGFEGFYECYDNGYHTPDNAGVEALLAAHPFDWDKYHTQNVGVGHFDDVGEVDFIYLEKNK